MTTIVGLDPSSRKLAFQILTPVPGGGWIWTPKVFFLKPDDMRARCVLAAKFISDLVMSIEGDVVIYKEAPVIAGPRGAWSVIPQCFVAGAMFVGLPSSVEMIEVNNKEWKARIGVKGGGSAKKHEIIRYIRENHPHVYSATLNRNGNPDQDLLDAAGVALYGVEDQDIRNRLGKMLRRRNG